MVMVMVMWYGWCVVVGRGYRFVGYGIEEYGNMGVWNMENEE